MTPPLGRDSPPTLWTQVRGLAGAEDAARLAQAWEHLHSRYRPAMVAYTRAMLRRLGNPHCAADEAEDVVQGFLVQCVEQGWLSKADPTRGRFRVFVRVLLRRYLTRYVRDRTAQKRAPTEGGMQTLDGLDDLLGDADAPDLMAPFQAEWAECLVRGALAKVSDRSERNARIVEALHAEDDAALDAVLDEFEVPEKQRPVARHRARHMFAEALWEELKETTGGDADLEAERLVVLPSLSRYLDEGSAPSLFGR